MKKEVTATKYLMAAALVFFTASALEKTALGQIQPADAQAPESKKADEQVRLRSWEQPSLYETVVRGTRPLRESELIGDYAQPRWTAMRRFPTTRIYVVPPGTFQFEWWNDWKFDLTGEKNSTLLWEYEVEMGLGHRLQLDLYVSTEKIGWNGDLELAKEKIELRYAFADWGKLWGNPTVYLEFINRNAASPKGEVKLLLGGEITDRWYWGSNLVFEREIKEENAEQEYAVTLAFSYAAIDEKFSVGAEVKGAMADFPDARFGFEEWSVLAGPSIQWRPVKPMHFDFVALFGADHKAEDNETTPIANPLLVVGWEF